MLLRNLEVGRFNPEWIGYGYPSSAFSKGEHSVIIATCKRFLRFWAPAGLLEAYRKLKGHRLRRRTQPGDEDPQLAKVKIEDLFPGVDSLAVNIPLNSASGEDDWNLPFRELTVLAAICTHCRPRRVFEIGTYKGSSTLAIALNTPGATEVFTLDLGPSVGDTHKDGFGPGGLPAYEVGSYYRASPVRSKIRQLLGNSATFDYKPYLHSVDFVFIDADHTYDCVRKDTETGLALLAPSGIILWDDYGWTERHPECAGVSRCLNELARNANVYQIEGTRLAIYCDGRSATSFLKSQTDTAHV